MSEKANGALNFGASFGGTPQRGRDLARPAEPNPRAFFALVVALSAAAAVAVAWSLDGHFRFATEREWRGDRIVTSYGREYKYPNVWDWTPASLCDLVVDDAAWAACAVSLSLAPFVYLWWRRSATDSFRWIGCALSLVPGAVTLWLTRTPSDYMYDSGAPHWGPGLLVFAAIAFAAAFSVAPPPRDPDAPDTAAVWRMKRRHRATA